VKILLPLFFSFSTLKAGITNFRVFISFERYLTSGKFENSLTKPFYKDYENSWDLFLNGFLYHRDFLRYELRNYFIWQGWNGNLKNRQERNFLKSPFSLNINLFPRSRFPFRFFVKKEELQKINGITFKRKILTYSVSQSLNIKNLPNLSFTYSWGKEEKKSKRAFLIKSTYSKKNHSFYTFYKREFPAVYPYSENYQFHYNFSDLGKIKAYFNFNYFFRKKYTYTTANLGFEKREKKDYMLTFLYFFNNSKFSTSNNFNISYRKHLSKRVSSFSSLKFSVNSLEQGYSFGENISQSLSLRFLDSPKSLVITPGVSLFFTQNFRGHGWGYLLREGNLFEHKKFLFFKTFRFFLNFYLKATNDKWIYKNELRKGYNSGFLFTYESKKYSLFFNFYLNRDIYSSQIIRTTWTRYFMRIELRTKEIPFYVSYNKEYIIPHLGKVIERDFLHILFRAPIKLMNIFTIDERLYFRNKLENNLKITFSRDYRSLILNISLEYIYLIYPGPEHNIIFHFYVKRKIRIK